MPAMPDMKVRALLTVACCALATAVSGCAAGGGNDAGDTAAARPASEAVAAVRAAADATTRAGTSRTRTTMTMEFRGRTVELSGRGVFDHGRRLGALTVDAPPEAGLSGPLQEVLTADALYLKNVSPGVPADKWVRLPITAVADGAAIGGGATDPGTSFEMLRGVNDDTVLVGVERLGDVAVRHYRGTLDIRKAHDLAPPRMRGPLAAALKTYLSPTVPFDAYLDEAGRLRKVREEFGFSATNGASAANGVPTAPVEKGRIVSIAELYDFGVPVDVRVPAPGELYDRGPAAGGR